MSQTLVSILAIRAIVLGPEQPCSSAVGSACVTTVWAAREAAAPARSSQGAPPTRLHAAAAAARAGRHSPTENMGNTGSASQLQAEESQAQSWALTNANPNQH